MLRHRNRPSSPSCAHVLRALRAVRAFPACGAISSIPAGPPAGADRNPRNRDCVPPATDGTSGLRVSPNCDSPDIPGRMPDAGAPPARAVRARLGALAWPLRLLAPSARPIPKVLRDSYIQNAFIPPNVRSYDAVRLTAVGVKKTLRLYCPKAR